jgi:hypothetical protein
MDYDMRFIYYIGNFWGSKHKIIVKPQYNIFKLNEIFHYIGPNQKYDNFPFDKGTLSPGFWWGYNNGFTINFKCLITSSDGFKTDNLPVLSKARIIGEINNGILFKANYNRHWSIFLKDLKDGDPVTWENKKNEIVWRGVHCTGRTKKANRRSCVSKYYNKYNIGFTAHKQEDDYYNNNKDFFKNYMSIKDMLNYKYLLCIEGNDVATSLKWMLASNSVVLMAKPMMETWLMEGLLKPYVHYVPLKDDFSDLDEILDWCKNNDSKCKQISQNARKWMKPFMNNEEELKLHNRITQWYKENIILE